MEKDIACIHVSLGLKQEITASQVNEVVTQSRNGECITGYETGKCNRFTKVPHTLQSVSIFSAFFSFSVWPVQAGQGVRGCAGTTRK